MRYVQMYIECDRTGCSASTTYHLPVETTADAALAGDALPGAWVREVRGGRTVGVYCCIDHQTPESAAV